MKLFHYIVLHIHQMAAGPIQERPMDNRLRIAQAHIIKEMELGKPGVTYEEILVREQEYARRMLEAMKTITTTTTQQQNVVQCTPIPTIDISEFCTPNHIPVRFLTNKNAYDV